MTIRFVCRSGRSRRSSDLTNRRRSKSDSPRTDCWRRWCCSPTRESHRPWRTTASVSRWPRILRATDNGPTGGASGPSCLATGVDDVDVSEARHWCPVADGVHLHRLSLRVAERPAQVIALCAAHHVEARPELRRLHLIRDISQHTDDLAALDLVEDLTAELRVVALLIDRERTVADDRNAAIRRGDQIVPAEILVARQQRDVRHALELHRGPRLRIRASVRSRRFADLLVIPVEPERLLSSRLIIDEDAFPNDAEVFGLHALAAP